jgi:ABC-2 type transport system ATP-binding protein
MVRLALELREKLFGRFPSQPEINGIGTQLDLLTPPDLPAGAEIDACKNLSSFYTLKTPWPARSHKSTVPSVSSENAILFSEGISVAAIVSPQAVSLGMIQTMDVAVRCRNLRKTYEGKVEAVRGLDLEILTGECFGLLGPNGAGKTTTIEILEGLLQQTSGEVEILGKTWNAHSRELREVLGISLQETRLAEKLTVRETLELFASFYRYPRSSLEVMEEMALTEKANSWVGKLSGGQRQRLAVATALVANPKILFLDEPTTGLDPQSRRQLWDIIRQFQRRGGTILLTTHYMDEAERLCDRIAIIDYGRAIAFGTPAELIEELGGQQMVEFEVTGNGGGAPDPWRSLPGVEAVHEEDGRVMLSVRETHETIPALLAALQKRGARLLRLTTRQASLEDVFVRLTGRHLREE